LSSTCSSSRSRPSPSDSRPHENIRMQFWAEAINVFNHTNFNTVSTSRTSGLYGQVLSARDARVMQLALKLNF
jgi:hypothetical protein